jgi:hypothetical protein
MDFHDHPFWTERFDSEADLRESNALVFTQDDMRDWDEDDFLAADLAMERDMAEREQCYREENASLRAEIEMLREELNMPEKEN